MRVIKRRSIMMRAGRNMGVKGEGGDGTEMGREELAMLILIVPVGPRK